MDIRGKSIYAFVDAANLFYGGEKSMHFRIDYEKLFKYLKEKFLVTKVFYYSGVDVEGYKEEGKKLDLEKLVKYYEVELQKKEKTEAEIVLMERHLERAKFYRDLEKIGYELRIKPTKVFTSIEGTTTTKANCDVDLTFDMMRFMSQYKEALVLSGDGDFAPILDYLKRKGKIIRVLARFERTAREIKELVGEDFIDFKSIRTEIEAERVKTGTRLPRRVAPRNDGKKKEALRGDSSQRKRGNSEAGVVRTVLPKSVVVPGKIDLQGDSSQGAKKSWFRKVPTFRKGF